MSEFVGKDGAGRDVKFIRHDGLTYPAGLMDLMQNGGLPQQLDASRNLLVRDTDVFIAAYVKSGTHWLWEIVHMLLHNTSNYSSKPKEDSMLDFRSSQQIADLPSPRLLNLHFPVRYFPHEAIEKRRPIIHIMRNPKDMAVSYYYHYSVLPAYQNTNIDFTSFLPMMLGENGFYIKLAWFEYELAWERFTKENPDYPILNLYYEDLKEDLEKWVRVIARFLKLEVDDALLTQIAENNEISNLRQGMKEARPDHHLNNVTVDGRPIMYRQGVVGGWKKYFTVADNEKMDAWLEKNLVDTDLKFKYTL